MIDQSDHLSLKEVHGRLSRLRPAETIRLSQLAAVFARQAVRHDAFVFEHDGDEFERADVDGITGIGNTTKLEEPKKIGTFGIGFKSVYVITDRLEIHTWVDGRPFAFAITDLVVPTAIPHEGREGWTRIVLPFRNGVDLASTAPPRSSLCAHQANVSDRLLHDPSPMQEARCRTPGATCIL